MRKVSSEPHVRRHVRQEGARTARNGQAATVWRCPKCGAEVGVYIEPSGVICSCGRHMVKVGPEEALEVALYAR